MYDSNGAATTLELYHLIGLDQTDSDQSSLGVFENKYVKLEVFEAHYTDTNTIEYCSTFSSTSNADLSVSIQVTNDVLTEDPCHSTKVAGSECYLDTVDADTGYVQFVEGTSATCSYKSKKSYKKLSDNPAYCVGDDVVPTLSLHSVLGLLDALDAGADQALDFLGGFGAALLMGQVALPNLG